MDSKEFKGLIQSMSAPERKSRLAELVDDATRPAAGVDTSPGSPVRNMNQAIAEKAFRDLRKEGEGTR